MRSHGVEWLETLGALHDKLASSVSKSPHWEEQRGLFDQLSRSDSFFRKRRNSSVDCFFRKRSADCFIWFFPFLSVMGGEVRTANAGSRNRSALASGKVY